MFTQPDPNFTQIVNAQLVLPSFSKSVCEACHGSCTRSGISEIYGGYTGAFRCLVEGAGDVAFIKPATVYSNVGNPNGFPWAQSLHLTDFELLCKDGSRAQINAYSSCNLAQSPPHGVMTSGSKSDTVIAQYQTLLENCQEAFSSDTNTETFRMFDSVLYSGSNILFKDSTQSLSRVNANYEGFLGADYVQSVMGLHKCPEGSVRFCTTSQQELKKCEVMREAFANASLTPAISCYQSTGHTECMEHIKADYADLVTLDGGDIYKAGSQFGLVPIMGEDYGSGDASYWAVAVVRRGSQFGIGNLNGKKSCHTGIMKTSGWIVPIGYLIQEGHVIIEDTDTCDVPAAVGNFFSQSCVPGANSSEYDADGSNPANLCALCIGSGEGDSCSRNSHERYYGYAGAFRCLADNAGEVAFVKHTTVSGNTIPNGQSDWNSGLKDDDYELLCPNGSRASIDDWRSCNLAQVPSHALMTSGNKSPQQTQAIVNLFTVAVGLFGSDDNTAGFKLFDSTGYLDSDQNSAKNLLFKDSANNLTDVGVKKTYQSWLGNDYLRTLKGIKCQ